MLHVIERERRTRLRFRGHPDKDNRKTRESQRHGWVERAMDKTSWPKRPPHAHGKGQGNNRTKLLLYVCSLHDRHDKQQNRCTTRTQNHDILRAPPARLPTNNPEPPTSHKNKHQSAQTPRKRLAAALGPPPPRLRVLAVKITNRRTRRHSGVFSQMTWCWPLVSSSLPTNHRPCSSGTWFSASRCSSPTSGSVRCAAGRRTGQGGEWVRGVK